MKISMKKKGSAVTDNMTNLILMAIFLGVALYFVWAYLIHGSGDSVGKLQQCGAALSLNKGSCKETCDLSLELELPDVGCKGVANKCCILKNQNSQDVILPSGYGKTVGEFDFSVTAIKFGNVQGCTVNTKKQNTITCPAGKAYSLPVVISVKNLFKETSIYADPIVVINGNGQNIRGPGKYIGKDTVTFKTAGQSSPPVTANIAITASEAKLNDYWDIYPYARCDTNQCTNVNAKGIFAGDDSMHVTVEFIN